ncbi:hypothetical protein CYMTET_54054 [Cymbomonas tetramitiformis]|uniref:Uncharacterized protein n=1 Tax=Cymbomonas tetramitiformis TaxID=36881 RepID=A0AAE0BH88_9CHLO|nr:hypothetical protein CYMTET_54054 [Cymbomonas tetramitiformis]
MLVEDYSSASESDISELDVEDNTNKTLRPVHLDLGRDDGDSSEDGDNREPGGLEAAYARTRAQPLTNAFDQLKRKRSSQHHADSELPQQPALAAHERERAPSLQGVLLSFFFTARNRQSPLARFRPIRPISKTARILILSMEQSKLVDEIYKTRLHRAWAKSIREDILGDKKHHFRGTDDAGLLSDLVVQLRTEFQSAGLELRAFDLDDPLAPVVSRVNGLLYDVLALVIEKHSNAFVWLTGTDSSTDRDGRRALIDVIVGNSTAATGRTLPAR